MSVLDEQFAGKIYIYCFFDLAEKLENLQYHIRLVL